MKNLKMLLGLLFVTVMLSCATVSTTWLNNNTEPRYKKSDKTILTVNVSSNTYIKTLKVLTSRGYFIDVTDGKNVITTQPKELPVYSNFKLKINCTIIDSIVTIQGQYLWPSGIFGPNEWSVVNESYGKGFGSESWDELLQISKLIK